MFSLGFKDKYKVLHVSNEFGSHIIGGAGTYLNEIYKYHRDDTGFIFMNCDDIFMDFNTNCFPGDRDILVMHKIEHEKINLLNCDILVVQFYDLDFIINEELIRDKKIVYVVHSVPTPEPPPVSDPFGGNVDVRQKFERLCKVADVIICVSEAEREKLISIYPMYAGKIRVVYNGISYNQIAVNENYKKSRRVFGFIGRTDYRKGIIEALEVVRNLDVELRIACPKNDPDYVNKIITYIDAAGMWDRVTFYGWCTGERRDKFFESLDALLVPSLYEPFGYVALEGMMMGLPLISSNNGGLDEILAGYKYKYSPYVRGDFERAMLEFINDSNEEVEAQTIILRENMARFTSEEMGRRYNEIFDSIA